jgi:hypothetical protein
MLCASTIVVSSFSYDSLAEPMSMSATVVGTFLTLSARYTTSTDMTPQRPQSTLAPLPSAPGNHCRADQQGNEAKGRLSTRLDEESRLGQKSDPA